VVHLVVGDRAERLTAQAGHGQDRDERQEAVLAGQSNSVYIHLISNSPATSVLMSRPPPAEPAPLQPPVKPQAVPAVLPGKPPSFEPVWPQFRSSSMPSTALVRPTANSKSGRKRVRAYHSRSLSRLKLPS